MRGRQTNRPTDDGRTDRRVHREGSLSLRPNSPVNAEKVEQTEELTTDGVKRNVVARINVLL